MLKRLGADHLAQDQRPEKRSSRSSSPAPVQKFDSDVTGSKSTTELHSSPRRTATFQEYTVVNNDAHNHPDDVLQGSLTPHTHSIVVEPPCKSACFRISGIPADWSIDILQENLQVIDPNLKFTDVDITGPFPASCDSTRTALLNFDNCTAYFQQFERNDQKLIVFREGKPVRKVRLVIDKHFYDLTPMNDPQAPIIAELVSDALWWFAPFTNSYV
jgi:hypothetical protein